MAITLIERARRYVSVMPAAMSGAGGHNATFAVACALVKGFNLSVDEARGLMQEYNGRCQPAWSDRELEHKLTQADRTSDPEPRGYLAGAGNHVKGEVPRAPKREFRPVAKAEYDPDLLKRFSGTWAQTVDLMWLANRSAADPASVSTGDFLSMLYAPSERVVMFNRCNAQGAQVTQGEGLWPGDEPLKTGTHGVWFLPQPVDGADHPNPRTGKMSRRSEESVTSWRFLVLESDTAPLREWLGVMAQLPLRIAAIYTSGGRSVHALVRVDALTKGQWDEMKREWFGREAPAGRFLIRNGLDAGVLSAVRLSRLPGAWREGKVSKEGRYVKFRRPEMQKLLYVCPDPRPRPLIDLLPKRDVEESWLNLAAGGISEGDDTGGRWLKEGLRYYARASVRIRAALTALLEAGVA